MDRTWTCEEDRLLQELKSCHIPWKYVSVAMGNRPIAQLKRRWYHLRDRRPMDVEAVDWGDPPEDGNAWVEEEDEEDEKRGLDKTRRRVSFADPLTTVREVGIRNLSLFWAGIKLFTLTGHSKVDDNYDDEDDDGDDLPRHPKLKKVSYIESEFTLKEVLLLHRIAAKWERDRWRAISTRFNDKTGHSLTPEQAKRIVNN
ncbi:uncharacterized protein LDX57_003739 [Aspergillus melleus]|uniref:uncharacterized protein n=1 Tax=Aspergillus melleus TaxID=138277 RepID=UPI001E8D6635|nr:uncharacterized protein LDX57_003739 [Aspergillus melleus]KAH8426001.1 hypothetical protein LDX57_003739 [Aspergillus melleus]